MVRDSSKKLKEKGNNCKRVSMTDLYKIFLEQLDIKKAEFYENTLEDELTIPVKVCFSGDKVQTLDKKSIDEYIKDLFNNKVVYCGTIFKRVEEIEPEIGFISEHLVFDRKSLKYRIVCDSFAFTAPNRDYKSRCRIYDLSTRHDGLLTYTKLKKKNKVTIDLSGNKPSKVLMRIKEILLENKSNKTF